MPFTPVRRRRALLGGAVAAACLVAAAPASAAQVGLGGGATSLKLDPGTARALKSLGVSVAPTSPARVVSGRVAFPITGGRIDPATGVGVYRHSGGLRLTAGRIRLTLTNFDVSVGKASKLTARVNGRTRVGILTPVLRRAKVTRNGLDTTVSRVELQLTAGGAAALNATFHVRAFTRGVVLGTVTVAAKVSEAVLSGGATSLALDPGAASALTSLGITVGTGTPATAQPDGSIAFPISAGRVATKTLAGTIEHEGGLTLTRGSTVVSLTDFTIDTAAATLSAALGSSRADILSLDLRTPAVTIGRQTLTVGNVTAKLTQGAADALNAAFSTTAFTAGLTLGVATVRATTE